MTSENDSAFKDNYSAFLDVSAQEYEICNEAISDFISVQEVKTKRLRAEDPPTTMTQAANGSTIFPDNYGGVVLCLEDTQTSNHSSDERVTQTSTLPLEDRNIKKEPPPKEQCTQQGKVPSMVKAELGSSGNVSASNFMRLENPEVSNTSAGGFGQEQQFPATQSDFRKMMTKLDDLSELVTTQTKEVRDLIQLIKSFTPEVSNIPQWQSFATPYLQQGYQLHQNYQPYPHYQHHPHTFPVLPAASSSGIDLSASSSRNQQHIRKARRSFTGQDRMWGKLKKRVG